MSVIAFDNTMLSALLNPGGKPPRIPGTSIPVERPKERAEAAVEAIARANSKIILPTPACAELLTAIGPDAQQYLEIVGRTRLFEVASFDALCAIELAILNRGVFKSSDDKHHAEPYQKRKVDRQIIAICKRAGATEIYTDDAGLASRAKLCGIKPISVSECPLLATEPQGSFLPLEPFQAISDKGCDDDG